MRKRNQMMLVFCAILTSLYVGFSIGKETNITVLNSVCDNAKYPNCRDFLIFFVPIPVTRGCNDPPSFDYKSCLKEIDFDGFTPKMGFGTGNTHLYSNDTMITLKDGLYVAVFQYETQLHTYEHPLKILCTEAQSLSIDNMLSLQDKLGMFRLTILITEVIDDTDTTMPYETTSALSDTILHDTTAVSTFVFHNTTVSSKLVTTLKMTNEKEEQNDIPFIISACFNVLLFIVLIAMLIKFCRNRKKVEPDEKNTGDILTTINLVDSAVGKIEEYNIDKEMIKNSKKNHKRPHKQHKK